MPPAVRLIVAALLAAMALPASAVAVVEKPFAPRFSANEPGAVWVTGSTTMTCPATNPACPAARAGSASGAALNNNAYAMEHVDTDADPATFSSSSSTFAPAAGSEVLFAGLYWGGRTSAGTGGAPAPAAAARGSALLRTPASGAYVPVTGAVADSTAGISAAYVAFADVTALVRAGGPGRYAVANVQSGTGEDRHAGWSLVVAYRNPALPLRNLTVFDGLATIQANDPALTITASGFRTPVSGPVNTSVGVVGYEGDRGAGGDRLALNGTLLSDAANPATNLFNSSVAFEGRDTLDQRIPAYVNGLGFDADRIVANGILPNGATSATLTASTTLEQYQIQALTFTTDLSTPRLALTKRAVDLDGGDLEPGDRLRYTLTATNTGDDAATGVRIADAVPARTAYVPGSGGAEASGVVGFDAGTLAPGASTSVAFDVTVGAGAPDGFVVRNVASVTGLSATLGRPVSALSPEVTATVRRPAFDVDVDVTPNAPVAGQPATTAVGVTNDLARPVEDVVATVELPGAEVLSATAGGRDCTVRGDRVRCALGTLAAGEDATIRIRFRVPASGALRPVVTVRGDGVPTVTRRLPRIRVRPGAARLSVTKTAGQRIARPGRAVRYRIVVRTAAGLGEARRVRVCDDPGAGLRLRSASRGGVLRDGRACWRLGRIAPGRRMTLHVVARVTAARGIVRNAAVVRAAHVRGRSRMVRVARVRVAPDRPSACTATLTPIAHAAC